MITLTMERLDHAVVLKLPTDHEHVMVALWRLGLNRDPHMYTLGELNAVFSYDTPEEHQMVRLIDMNNSLHFALCSLHEMLAPPVPYAQQLRKKLQSGSYRSAKDFYYDMESLVFDPKHMMTYFYFPVSGEVVAKDGSVTKADDDMLCDYHKMIEFAMYTVQSQTYFWETELFSDVKGVPEKLAFAGWSIEEMDGVLFGEVLLMHLEPFTDEELEDLAEKIEQIPFTEQQREQARLTDLAAYLRQCGEEVKRCGSENMWLDHGQKVTIRGNLWFHQYEQVGGDAVDFVCRFYGLDYREAVLTLVYTGVGTIREPVEPFPKKPLQIPAVYENMRRVYGYLLRRRGIDKEVLDAFAYRGLIYECAQYHNAVFVGTDKAGKIRHIHKRSTAAQGGFKGNAPGSEPEYSFHWHGGGDVLYLFEAPIDMLSFISMYKHCWKSQSYAASCGVSDKVLWQMLKDGPHIKKVYICYDNDEPGRQAAQRISRALTERSICHEIYPPAHKDWNEELLHKKKGKT